MTERLWTLPGIAHTVTIRNTALTLSPLENLSPLKSLQFGYPRNLLPFTALHNGSAFKVCQAGKQYSTHHAVAELFIWNNVHATTSNKPTEQLAIVQTRSVAQSSCGHWIGIHARSFTRGWDQRSMELSGILKKTAGFEAENVRWRPECVIPLGILPYFHDYSAAGFVVLVRCKTSNTTLSLVF